MDKIDMTMKDPFAEREAQKYEKPIPSREFILNWLAEHGTPVNYNQLVDALRLETDDEKEGLRRRLIAMLRDAQLMQNRRGAYALVKKMDLIPGRVQAHKDGYGFLLPEDGSEDLYLNAKQMRAVLHGDRVLARVAGVDPRGRKEGVIVEVLERNTDTVVGKFIEDNGAFFVTPSAKNLPQDILIPADKTHDAVHGQMVHVKIIAQPNPRRQACGEVMEILGEHMDPGMEIDVAILGYHIPNHFPQEVLNEVKHLSDDVTEAEKAGRTDLRNMPLITIDGEDARDFDDAVYCEPLEKGAWRLVVAIADVSHYVQRGTALDTEAESRGNSVYFPERVIPMLPEKLSNGLCSLNPHVDRLCMVCDMEISATGEVTKYRFYDAVMNSKARMTYTKVHAILEGNEALRDVHKIVVPQIENLSKLFHVLREHRVLRGALDFETVETRIIFSDTKKIERIVPVVRNDAHMLIEECMLAANECAAKFLIKQKLPGLYRIHEAPKAAKLDELRQFIALQGLQLGGGDNPTPKDFQQLLEKIRAREDGASLQMLVLRSLTQAQYSPDNVGHFGLAYKEYGHFTSPIRRYPDLLLHRAIRHFLSGGTPENFKYNLDSVRKIGEHCSMTERRADEATRDVVSWLKCEYMSHRVGDVFSGKVTAVVAFGLFVQLEEVYVEGLVHVTNLKDDYYHFDAAKQLLMGERTRIKYGLGQELKVRVAKVDLDQRKIDFELV